MMIVIPFKLSCSFCILALGESVYWRISCIFLEKSFEQFIRCTFIGLKDKGWIPFGMRHALFFHVMSWRHSECVFSLHNELRWPTARQIRGLSFSDKSGTNSPTPDVWKALLSWTGNSTREPPFRSCMRQPAPPSTAPSRAHSSDYDDTKNLFSRKYLSKTYEIYIGFQVSAIMLETVTVRMAMVESHAKFLVLEDQWTAIRPTQAEGNI